MSKHLGGTNQRPRQMPESHETTGDSAGSAAELEDYGSGVGGQRELPTGGPTQAAHWPTLRHSLWLSAARRHGAGARSGRRIDAVGVVFDAGVWGG